MKLNVEIRVMNEVRTGVSSANGLPWKMQDVVVAWKEQMTDSTTRENLQLVTLHGENVDRFAKINPQVGITVLADLSFGTRTYGGRVYNDNRMYV